MNQIADVGGWADSIASEFQVSGKDIQDAVQVFVKQLNEGLKADGTSLLQVPSFVTKLPNGTEKGICMGIDLGGTNLRICSVELHGDSTFSVTQSKVPIPLSLMTAKTYTDLFGFIANQTELFMRTNMQDQLYKWFEISSKGEVSLETRQQHFHSLGFTFSFTFDQYAINKGTLMYWTKAFNIKDAVGRDPCAMLQEAFTDRNLPLTVTALVNDTVGALAARAYCAPSKAGTLLGAIFGTGTNGAYMEKISNIQKLNSNEQLKTAQQDGYMALNTEWGGFDRELSVLSTTTYDEELDRDSINPNDQYYEKRISGLYLGELLRRVVAAGAQRNMPGFTLKFPSESRLYAPYSINSSSLSSLVQDDSPQLEQARTHIAQMFGTVLPTVEEAQAMKSIAMAIGRRAARLSAIAIGGIVIQSGRLTSLNTDVRPCGIFTPTWTLSSFIPKRLLRIVTQIFGRWWRGNSPSFKSIESLTVEGPSDARSNVLDVASIIDIGVDGSLFEFFPGFEDCIREALREISEIGPQYEPRLRMGAAADGSGVGAALIALLHKPETI